MQCPRCKMEDVYLSSSGNSGTFSFFTKSARCHRCCYLFRVARWADVPEKKDALSDSIAADKKQRVA